jgi:hypothetical protein
MDMNVIYVGLDVDDTQHHGSDHTTTAAPGKTGPRFPIVLGSTYL